MKGWQGYNFCNNILLQSGKNVFSKLYFIFWLQSKFSMQKIVYLTILLEKSYSIFASLFCPMHKSTIILRKTFDPLKRQSSEPEIRNKYIAKKILKRIWVSYTPKCKNSPVKKLDLVRFPKNIVNLKNCIIIIFMKTLAGKCNYYLFSLVFVIKCVKLTTYFQIIQIIIYQAQLLMLKYMMTLKKGRYTTIIIII